MRGQCPFYGVRVPVELSWVFRQKKEETRMKLTKNEWLRSVGRQMRQSSGVAVMTAMGLLGIALVQAACAQALSTTTVHL
jgi:hypothetical protein